MSARHAQVENNNFVTTITVRYKTSDFLRLALHTVPRSAALKWAMLGVAVVVFATNCYQSKAPWEPATLIATVITTALFSIVYLPIMAGLAVIIGAFRNRRSTFGAEPQSYSITDSGLARQSPSSETLTKWSGMRSLRKSRKTIYVEIYPLCYVVLPRHSFASDEEYESAWNSLQKHVLSSRSLSGQERS